MSNPFDYINSINSTKKNLMVSTDNDRLAEKGYEPFLANRALSYHNDTIALANEMNIRHYLDKSPQYMFLLNTVRPKKRYGKWEKKTSNADLDLVKGYYGYSDVKARQALTILTEHNLAEIREKTSKGGKS